MPPLKQFDAGDTTLRPTERGVDARLQEARRTAGFYNEAAGMITAGAAARATAAGDVARVASSDAEAVATFAKQQEDYAGHREVSAGAAASAKLFDQLNDNWNNTVKSADPNDPSVAAKFRETVLEPSLQQFNEAYSNTDRGRQWSEQHVESMRNHFFQKTASDMSTLAGDAVKVNARNLANESSNAAFKSPDFHTVDYLLDKTTNDVGEIIGSSPNVKGADSSRIRTELTEKTKEQIVNAAASGAIAKSADPEKTAADFASRYPDYINGAQANAQARAAKVQAKANLLTDKQIETYQRQQDDRAVHTGSAKIMTDNVSFDDNGRATVKPDYFRQSLDLARQYPNAPAAAATVHSMITWGEHQQNQKAQPTTSDPAVKADLYSRMFDPTNPTSEIELMKANVEGRLSPHDFQAMHQMQKTLEETPLKGEVMKDTLAAAKARLTYTLPGFAGKDPNGLAKYSSFIQTFVPQYLAATRAGTLPPNALDLNDPNSMIGKSIQQFKRTSKQMIDDRVQELRDIGLPQTGTPQFEGDATPPPAGPSTKPDVVVNTKEQYDALKSGTNFTDRTGKKFRKP